MTVFSPSVFRKSVMSRDAVSPMNAKATFDALRPAPEARMGLRVWLAQSAIGRALAARRAERDLNVAVMRLSELSPHLLHDIGVIEEQAQVEEPSAK